MPKYISLFASAKSVQETWNLTGAGEAKKIYELWDLAYEEVGANKEPYLDLIKDAQTYLTQKPREFDEPDNRYARVKVSISRDQWTMLVNIYGVLLLMRGLEIGGTNTRTKFSTMWSGLKGKERGDADAAKQTAREFNYTYAADEFQHYLKHLADKDKDFTKKKPYVVPAKQDKFDLYVWYKK